MKRSVFLIALFAVSSFSVALAGDESGAKPDEKPAAKPAVKSPSAKLQAAVNKIAGEQTYDLHYRLSPGEKVRWKVVQLQTVETKIRRVESVAKMRSVSKKLWTVSEVDADGNITFVHQVESVDMWSKLDGQDEERYNSETDEKAPPKYEAIAMSVGKPLATITMNRHGGLVKRDQEVMFQAFGLGKFAVPLPDQPVKVGESWQILEDVKVKLDEARTQTIKTRQVYTLQKVEAGLATIDVRTELLTPVNDPKVESQLVQRLTHGTVKFDVDAGRLVSKELNLDKTVIGFSGAESSMSYLARFTEELLPENEAAAATAKKPAGAAAATK